MIIAIDGPAGAGKSTTARALAERFGFAYIDTGAMYRAVALAAAERDLGLPHDAAAIADLAHGLTIMLKENGRRIFLGEREVSAAIRQPHISDFASQVAALGEVRAVIVEHQRRLVEQAQGECGGAVLEGRDIQTVVCPQAEVKIFLTADPAARAMRRLEQWHQKGGPASLDEARHDVSTRDQRDSSRQTSPLRAASDAIMVATDDLTIEEVVERIAVIIQEKLASAEH